MEAIPHFTCRDRSLLGTQADLLGAHVQGIRNIPVTTGDPPKHGPYPSKAVYDYNTIQLIQLEKPAILTLVFHKQTSTCSILPEGETL
jgi:methylenetetrahydrofolate reductase (NADPH)